jgi:hypothetical protein
MLPLTQVNGSACPGLDSIALASHGADMKQSNLRPRLANTVRRTAGHAQQGQILDPTNLGKSCITGCPQCGTVYQEGRWQWSAREGVIEELCAACRRIKDKFPAGVVTLRGDFAGSTKRR